jgi:hypothetical protein
MLMNPRLRHLILSALLLSTGYTLLAQGPPGRDPYNQPPGHGGMPPGQAKKMERSQGMPPGQSQRYFRDDNRGAFYSHYRRDADRWRSHQRPVFVPGQALGRGYALRPVPRSVWVNVVAPPPPGYQYGYYGGYIVAYNPATRIVADVLDLIDASRMR